MKFPIVSSLFLLATASSASPLNCDDGVEAKVDVKYFVADGLPSGGLSSLDSYATDTTTSINYNSGSGEFGKSGRADNVAALFQGYLNVDLGITQICITSDDGSKLFLDDTLWIDNGGVHAAVTKCADVSSGVHKFDLEYFERNGLSVLVLRWGTSINAVTLVPPTAWACAPKEKARFEKFGWYKADDIEDIEKAKCFPGGKPVKVEFPIDEDSAYCLRYHSNSVSVKSSASNGECSSQLDFKDLIDGLRTLNVYPPLQPEDKAFLTEFAEVVRAQKLLKLRKDNPCMTDPLPQVMKAMTQLWKGFSILDVAEAVHDEFPGIYHNQMIANWLATPGNAVFNNDVIPKTGNKDFIRGPVMLSQMIGFAIRAVGPCDFTLKWSVGRARPEEIAWKVYQGDFAYEEAAFDDVKNSILDMNLKSATDFTAYAEGSPTHPSWPAMHSAASAASFWLDIVMDLTEEQLCEARMLDYSVSYARTVAGVHYPSDNIAGLIAGEEILARKLPDLLHEEYGSDKDYVKDVIRKKKQERKFDWSTFEDSPCYKNSKYKTVTAAKPLYCYDQRDLPLLDVTAPQPPGSFHSEL